MPPLLLQVTVKAGHSFEVPAADRLQGVAEAEGMTVKYLTSSKLFGLQVRASVLAEATPPYALTIVL